MVTGAANRIGRHIAQGLADAGANVAITYQSSHDAALNTLEDLCGRGVNACVVELDLTKPADCARAVEQVERDLGPVDVLVNNASSFTPTPFPTMDHQGWYDSFDVVLHGPYHLSNSAAPGMTRRGTGSIINLVDLSAWHPWPNRGAHSVAKAALLALTRQLAVELAPTVRVNAIAPGPTIPAIHPRTNRAPGPTDPQGNLGRRQAGSSCGALSRRIRLYDRRMHHNRRWREMGSRAQSLPRGRGWNRRPEAL